MKRSEMSKIERSVFIQAPRARVWRALTEPELLGRVRADFGAAAEAK